MRVALGRKGDYSVRAVLDLSAIRAGERRKAREIAADMEIPQRYVTQILADLVREGILTAVAGPGGGYALAKPAEDLTLLEVVEAAEGPVTLDRCVLRGGPCGWTEICPVHGVWTRAQQALVDELARITFAELARIDTAIEAGTFRLPAGADHPEPTRRLGTRGRSAN